MEVIMTFLNQTKNKTKKMLTVKHPLQREAESVKVPIVIGIPLLMARADDDF